jgi:hypothetical protein
MRRRTVPIGTARMEADFRDFHEWCIAILIDHMGARTGNVCVITV